MHRAQTLFYVAAGIFLLAVSYHLGAQTASAQVGSSVTGMVYEGVNTYTVMTPNGDVFRRQLANGSLNYLGNYWAGGPAPTQQQT